MDNKGLENITKMYDKLTYFDQYGASVILFVIITIILLILISYCFVKINSQPIIDDWPNQRCKPYIIPFAGFITHPEGISATDYTLENFNSCTQSILSSITGVMVQAITFVINSINSILNEIKDVINDIRAMFDKIRTFFELMAKELMGRIMNMMIPLQQIIISVRDVVGKIQGTMTAGLFTLLGTYYTLQSLMGAIAQFIIIILIALAALIVIMWIIPFTWPVALANTTIFVAIAIPMVIILAFMVDVLQVTPDLSIPTVQCFDENTKMDMNDGTQKNINEVNLGDILINNNKVTSIIKVNSEGSIMYKLGDIIVSDSHIIKYKDKWMPISKHPEAFKYDSYNKPYLYCINTESKVININQHIFTDWDEIFDKELIEVKHNNIKNINENKDIHKYLDSGFFGNTEIKLQNGKTQQIKNIKINDILENGEKVRGLVQINGSDLVGQYRYNLNNKTIVEGGPNISICDKKIQCSSTLYLDGKNKEFTNIKENKLYHLLTDSKTFIIGDVQFYDYNASIDLFLEKHRGKLLSMKYV